MERRHRKEVEAQQRAEARVRREAAEAQAAQIALAERQRAQAKLRLAQESWRGWKPERRKRSQRVVQEETWVMLPETSGMLPAHRRLPEWARQLAIAGLVILGLAVLATWLWFVVERPA